MNMLVWSALGFLSGAVPYSLLVGWLGERYGLRSGMTLLYLTLGYIFVVGLRARPIVDNVTLPLADLLRTARARD